jgi:hypothetical protein
MNIRSSMLKRCNDPSSHVYQYYGGRGIKVCDRWTESHEAFIADVSPRPAGKTLDRRDNDGPYSPENCRWATRAEQVRNRRCSIWVDVGGERLVLKDACDRLGLSYMLVQSRMKKQGWSWERAITTPVIDRQSPADALAQCGNPAWLRCNYCRTYDDPVQLHVDTKSIYHRACRNAHYRATYRAKKGTACHSN